MKIVDLKFEKLRIHLNEPIQVAFGELDHSDNVLVCAITDEGIVGYGEAAPLPFVTGETADTILAALAYMKPGLIGCDPFAIDDVHHRMDALICGNSSAVCAVDLAMYDIMGKATGLPIYRILGGEKNRIQNDVTIGIDEPESMVRAAKHYTDECGYRILKIKAGRDYRQDLQAISMIRQAVGENIRLRVDANQGYSVPIAVKMIAQLEKLNVDAIEQCLPAWDLEGSAYLRNKANGMRIMLDESLHSPRDAAKICKLGAADILNIKLMKCGGLYPALKIASVADAYGLECMVGCMFESRLAATAGLSLVASRANITESDCDCFMYYDAEKIGITGGFTADGDILQLVDKPGFGIDINI